MDADQLLVVTTEKGSLAHSMPSCSFPRRKRSRVFGMSHAVALLAYWTSSHLRLIMPRDLKEHLQQHHFSSVHRRHDVNHLSARRCAAQSTSTAFVSLCSPGTN